MWKSWIPNGLSLGNLSCGFLAVVVAASPSGDAISATKAYFIAGIFIVIAVLLDGLDGPMARMLKVEGPMGEQLDSLADLTTFGIAPGFLMYKMFLSDITLTFFDYIFPLGMIIALLHPICAAYRLARFNVAHDPKSFVGLPSPIAGIFVALLPIVGSYLTVPKAFAITMYVVISFLMVSNVKYSKPQVGMKNHLTIFRLILLLLVVAALSYSLGWHWVISAIILLYILSGIIALFITLIQKFGVGYKSK